MSSFDRELKAILSEEDEAFIADHIEETGFYSEVFGSFRGKGRALHIMTWAGILIFGGGLIFCVWKFVTANTVQEQIFFGVFAIMLNSAQIALKLWFNMRLNRRAILREINRLHLAMMRGGA